MTWLSFAFAFMGWVWAISLVYDIGHFYGRRAGCKECDKIVKNFAKSLKSREEIQ